MNYKYIILDFGNVIAGPKSGSWNITEKFKELIDIDTLDKVKLENLRLKYKNILSEKLDTQEEEYDMFTRFYDSILKNMNIANYNINVAKQIAYDRTYNNDKYVLFDGVKDELAKLKAKYKLILLTDNWPSVYDYLKVNDLNKYFEKVYVSSEYGVEKKDGLFFDYPIKDFNIKKGEALFIDDNETNLKIAKGKGLNVLLMDRKNKVKYSKHKIIHNLSNIL